MEVTPKDFSKIRFSKEIINQGIKVKTATVDKQNAKFVVGYRWKIEEARTGESKISQYKEENEEKDNLS
jgi:hypothetical protein